MPSLLSKKTFKKYSKTISTITKSHIFLLIGLIPVVIWCLPYFTTGNKVELGDFSFFAQGYEAIRISIVEYGQFPWWNPWVSGGIPLYANPQFGLFSIPTLFTLISGNPVLSLKMTLVLFTIFGYLAMYFLTSRYFKIDKLQSTLISLIWVFCSFFASHLPTHFTFIWYLLAPFFIYLALSVKTWKGGIGLGVAFAVMANTQLHNPFVHISIIVAFIILSRLIVAIVQKKQVKSFLLALGSAAGVFIVLAGHRLVFTYQNMYQFPRDNIDLAPSIKGAFEGLVLPYSNTILLPFKYPAHPIVPHGFHEATGTFGLFCIVALLLSIIFSVYVIWTHRKKLRTIKLIRKQLVRYYIPIVLIGSAVLSALIGLGHKYSFMPYALMKHLPILSEMRVSTRWYIFAILFGLIFIGIIYMIAKKERYLRFTLTTLLIIGVVELFLLNVGYQTKRLNWQPNLYSGNSSQLAFGQISYFGKIKNLPETGVEIPQDSKMPAEYREFEATSYNLGVLYANDSFVQIQLANQPSPRCGIDKGCSFVLSKNAVVTFWSPNKIILKRTGDGDIYLNLNASSYMLVNGTRVFKDGRISEPFEDTIIRDPSQEIIIEIKPSLVRSAYSIVRHMPEASHDYIHEPEK